VVSASGGMPRLLTDGEFDFWPSWSPDGKIIVFERWGGLYTIPAEGGTPGLITADTIQVGNPAPSNRSPRTIAT
jgi:Tol biopolymer transport system component